MFESFFESPGKNMKILFSCGNAPGLPTGYGGQGLLALTAFQNAGAKVDILAWNLPPALFTPYVAFSTEEIIRKLPNMNRIFDPKESAKINWTDISWYANPYPQFPVPIRKNDMNRLIANSQADLFVTLQDIFMFEPGPFACLSAVWMPLHFVPVEHPTILALSDFDLQLPISGWGSLLLQPLQNANPHAVRHISVVPHGRDLQVYNTLRKTKDLIQETRKKLNWPEDAFVVLMIASNSEESGRKAFDAQLQGFRKFVKANPEKKIWLHIHSEVVRAYDLGRLLETFGEYDDRSKWTDLQDHRFRTHKDAIVRGDHVSITPASDLMSFKEEELVNMYYAADVLLAATCSEGCGVPILEAQLCGTPVVTTKATAMWEETHFGISVKPLQWIARMDFNSGWMVPHAEGIGNALNDIFQWSPEEKKQLFDKALPILQKEFSNEAVVNCWKDICEIVQESIDTNYKTEKLQLSSLRKLFLQATKSARTKLKLLQVLQEEVAVMHKSLLDNWSIKEIGRELESLETKE
jgi:glycosyltransferase involved in cell wall biosynthesis